jgi:prepilin-type N-terminal cleavage/methylation domain-containing protein
MFSNPQPPKQKLRISSAFTLVEMIVSIAIFSIVAVVALGALTKVVASNRKAQSLQSSITNLNFMMDSISRELRLGTYYTCDTSLLYNYLGDDLISTTPCTGLGAGPDQDVFNTNVVLVFKTPNRVTDPSGATCSGSTAYEFMNNAGVVTVKKAIQRDCTSGIQSTYFSDIVDPNVTLTSFYIKVANKHNGEEFGISDIPSPYPLATLVISGYSGIRERDRTYFDVQTSVSPRVKDF